MAVKSLNTLIKIHRREIDELKRKIAILEQQREALIMLSGQLVEELEREIGLALEQIDMGNFFGNYADRIQKRQEQIQQEVKNLNRQIQQVQVQVTEKFSELKKFEIARDNRLREQAEREKKAEDKAMDELGIRQHLSKESANT